MAFWLAHHHPEEYARTVVIGPLRVCARCLGTYPTLFLAIALQLGLKAPLSWTLDLPLGVALLLPALIDWTYGRFRPLSGSNSIRLLSGILLGLALGRSLYIHLQRPFPTVLVAQLLVSCAVAGPVLLWTYRPKNTDIDRR
ncbi:MAG: DUF2085 domain-containing protein [Myxococcaceae bacterium]